MTTEQLVTLMLVVPLLAMLFVAWGVRARSWRFPTIHDRARFASIYAFRLPPEIFTGGDPNLATATDWRVDAAKADGEEERGNG